MKIGEGKLLAVAHFGNLLDGGLRFFFFDARVATQVERLRGEGQAAAGVFDHVHHAQQKVFANGGEFVEVLRQDVGETLPR